MEISYIQIKKGKLGYGLATRSPDTYAEGEYRVRFYANERTRDRAAKQDRRFMPVVVTFELDIAELADLT